MSRINTKQNIKNALNWAINELKQTSPSPELDSEVFLFFAIRKGRAYLYTHPEKKLTSCQLKKFRGLINRRKKYEPVAYITGDKEFYGLKFKVNKNVLIPRPETETIVEAVLEIFKTSRNPSSLIDVGAGSGCIPIAIAHELRRLYGRIFVRIFGIDISAMALNTAKENSRIHRVDKNIKFIQSDLLSIKNSHGKIPPASILKKGGILLIAANLPYLSESLYKKCAKDIKLYEPRKALTAGKDGLKYYKKLFGQIKKLYGEVGLKKIFILCEIDPSQTKPMRDIVKKYFFSAKIKIKKDLGGLDRIVIIEI